MWSRAEHRFPLLRRDLWRILMGRGVLWLEEKCVSALLNRINWTFSGWKLKKKWVWIIRASVLCIYQQHDWNRMESDFCHQILHFCCCPVFLVVWREALGMFSMQWWAYLSCANDHFGLCPVLQSWCKGCCAVPKDRSHGPPVHGSPSVSASSWPGILACNLLQGIKEWIQMQLGSPLP